MIKMSNKSSKRKTRKSKSNALVHGVYARDFLLPWESEEDFRKQLGELRSYWKPGSCLENEAVLDIARFTWQKHRAMRMLQASFQADPFTRDIVASGKKSWGGITKYLLRQAEADMPSQMRKMISELIDDTRKCMAKAVEEESDKDEIARVQEQVA